MTKLTKCPGCNKRVEAKSYEGKVFGYYEERPLSALEKKVQKRLGIPFRTLQLHECKEVPPCNKEDEKP